VLVVPIFGTLEQELNKYMINMKYFMYQVMGLCVLKQKTGTDMKEKIGTRLVHSLEQ